MAKINLADTIALQTRRLVAIAAELKVMGENDPRISGDVDATLKGVIDEAAAIIGGIEAFIADHAPEAEAPEVKAPAAPATPGPRKALTRMIRLPSERVTVTQEVFDGDRVIARLWATQASQGLPVMMCIYDREALKEAYCSGSFVLPESVHSYFLMSPSR